MVIGRTVWSLNVSLGPGLGEGVGVCRNGKWVRNETELLWLEGKASNAPPAAQSRVIGRIVSTDNHYCYIRYIYLMHQPGK